MKISAFSVLAVACCLQVLRAQDTSLITLTELLRRVETNYPSILQYQQNISAITSRAEGADSWMPPTFSAGVMRFPYDLSMIREKNNPMNQAGVALSIEQMIPNSAKLRAKTKYIESLADIEKSKRGWTINELRRTAKVLYYSRHVAEKKLLVVSESEALLLLLISTSEAKFSNDQSRLQTLFKAKARLAEVRNMQYMLQGMIEESNIGLNILMVKEVSTGFLIDTVIVPPRYDTPVDVVGVVSSRSDISVMSKSIQSMKLEQEVMNVGNLPDFGIRAEHMQMFGMPNQWSVMGMVSIPIVPWASQMNTSESAAIGFQIQSMEQQKESMVLMAMKMLAEKRVLLKYENGQYDNYREDIIPAFQNNLQANLLAYKQNTGEFFVLLDAWEMLLMKQLEMFDKKFNVLKLSAEYEYENETR